ncbi:MAG: right-handed parallel beta-helix repeat-containing protein [Pseudomonadota bacterium]
MGPSQQYATPDEVPWESLQPGDLVQIFWRATPYASKWVLCRRGTQTQPIVIQGLRGPGGERPVITGDGATTRQQLSFSNEARGVLKIGSASTPSDTLPAHIVVEGLHLRSARPGYFFTDDAGQAQEYVTNAAALYVEKAEHLVLRDNELSDSGNGLFIGVFDGATQDILVEGNVIHDNGIEGRAFEHNSYTAAIGITFQFNRYGALRPGCNGNNLKDRSAGLVVRYNWIESGNRQLDLVDGEDSPNVVNHPSYHRTYVYGNVLIEPDGAGNSQIVHYGGDSGTEADYRKGVLHFFNNTVVSTRSTNTTLLRLSTAEESAELRNNLVYTSAGAGRLALLEAHGNLILRHNWLRQGYVSSHEGSLFDGTVLDDGTNLVGTDPGFVDEGGQDFALADGASCVNAGGALHAEVLPTHDVVMQYLRHQAGEVRPFSGVIDIGAFERCASGSCARPDAGAADRGGVDTAADDAAAGDGLLADAAHADAAATDVPVVDTSTSDSAMPDVTPSDATRTDTLFADAARSDTPGAADGTTPDRAGSADAGARDTPSLDLAAADATSADGAAVDRVAIDILAADVSGRDLVVGADAGATTVGSGCGCAAAGAVPGTALLLLLALAMLGRQRRQ